MLPWRNLQDSNLCALTTLAFQTSAFTILPRFRVSPPKSSELVNYNTGLQLLSTPYFRERGPGPIPCRERYFVMEWTVKSHR